MIAIEEKRVTEAAAAPRAGLKDIVSVACAIVGAAAVVGGVLRTGGEQAEKVADHTRRIVELERKVSDTHELMSKIDGRTIRIETKMEMLVPAKELTR